MYKTLKVDINGNIAIITLTRVQQHNAFNHEMAVDLLRAFEEVQANQDVRAVLLRADGEIFSVGGDIKIFADKLDNMPADVPDTMEVLNATITTMINLSKPILVAVQGAVAGVGLSLMLACDLAIAVKETRFTLAYADLGLTPDGGATYLLPRIIGTRRAMQMALLPESLSAKQVLELGLINWMVAADQFDKQTMVLMHKLANGPSIVYKRAKELINHSWQRKLEDQLTSEMHAFTECTTTKDFRRGVESFLSKTKAIFLGD